MVAICNSYLCKLCFVFDLNKNLTLKKDNLFSFSSLNRFFALSLQRNQILNKDYYGNGN